MKGALIFDMPDNCRDCPYFSYHCKLTNKKCNWYGEDGRHEDCPLTPLPEPMEICGKYPQPGKTVPSYRMGWNDCLKAIDTQNLAFKGGIHENHKTRWNRGSRSQYRNAGL